MADWSTPHPRGTAEQRYLNNRTAAFINPVIVADLARQADFNIDLVTNVTWDTSNLSGYTLANQPGATVSGTSITLTEAGTYAIYAGIRAEVTAGVGPYTASLLIQVGANNSGPAWQTWPAGSAQLFAFYTGVLAAGTVVTAVPGQNGATVSARESWIFIEKVSN